MADLASDADRPWIPAGAGVGLLTIDDAEVAEAREDRGPAPSLVLVDRRVHRGHGVVTAVKVTTDTSGPVAVGMPGARDPEDSLATLSVPSVTTT